MKKKIGAACSVAVAVLAVSNSLLAHHSESMLDKDRLIKLKGTILQHRFLNPHQIFTMKVADADGRITIWTVQGTPPGALRDVGWTKDSLKAGDEAEVTVYANKDGRPGASWVRILKSDGTGLPLPVFKKRFLAEYLQLHGRELSDEEYEIYKRSVTTGVGAVPDPAKGIKMNTDPTRQDR
jgi:hypothetical protein